MTTTLIKNGTLITPSGELRGDLLLAGEKIAAIGIDLSATGIDRVIDAAGCVVLPGLVDPHTHIVLDTGIYKTPDDWAVGTRTAACGGVTTVIDFATQFAGQDMHQALAARQAEVGGLAQIDYGLHMMLTALPETRSRAGGMDGRSAGRGHQLDQSLHDLPAELLPGRRRAAPGLPRGRGARCGGDDPLRERRPGGRGARAAGASGQDRTGVPRPGAARAGGGGGGEPGVVPGRSGGGARSGGAEGQRGGGTTGPQVYVVHCSASGTVDEVAQAVRHGQPAIAETTVQYLTLDETVYTGPHPEWGIMQPPLREENEKILLWKQVADGVISTIGTDHCDYTIGQKREHTEFTKTPGGIPGLETLLPLLATEGVAAGRISWSRLVEVCCAQSGAYFWAEG